MTIADSPSDMAYTYPSQQDENAPFKDVDAVMNNDQASTVYAPPAHLQARLNRNRARLSRRSSASTSRRNSLSSVQSHASSMSRARNMRAGMQTHYIAQHLRRASIIENRRARLADRAAHAEQVRLRAAIVKAAPRASLSNSEEKAVAAQLAKERLLAKVAAACAEEVARAKRIAEEVKERKQAEENKARHEMEERHAEAEKRRAEFQRNLQARRARRADSADKKLAVVEEDSLPDETSITQVSAKAVQQLHDEPSAATIIQRAWRDSQRRAITTAFLRLDLNARRSVSCDFEEMTALVSDRSTIVTTTNLLTHIGLQHESGDHAALNTRTFLSAYMLVGHSAIVLNNRNGAQEQDLIAKANELISAFEHSLSHLTRWNSYKPSPTHLETLSQLYSSFTSAFAAWRLQDSSVLIEGMIASFVELDAIWQTVKDDNYGEAANDYKDGIRDNQVKLLCRIQRLAGRDRADVLIKKAIRESRRRRPKKRAVAEVRPRILQNEHVMTPPDITSATSEDEAVSHHSNELGMLFTAMPSNRVLTHELSINKDYRIEEDKQKAELKELVYRSICESMKLGFQSGQGAVWTVSAAENLREKLLRMLKPGNTMYNTISETLDLEHISNQCQAGLFNYDRFFEFIADVLPKLCAPFRDQEVKTLVDELLGNTTSDHNVAGDELTIMTNKLYSVLRMVDKLSLDYSNFMLMSAAPTLIKEAPGYEHRLFASDLGSGRTSLERTQAFWIKARRDLQAEADLRDPHAVRLPEDRPKPLAIYFKALVDLAVAQHHLQNEEVPETLTLDFGRFKEIRAGAMRVAVIGGIFLTAKNLLKRDVRAQWKTEAQRMWTMIANEGYEAAESDATDIVTPAQKAFSILETAHNMPASTKAQVSSAITRFFAQAAARRLTDPVLKVLYQRLKTHIYSRVTASSASERVRAASSASEALAKCGLAEATLHVGAMVDTLERIASSDWASHALWYEQLAAAETPASRTLQESS